ncbi:uncharacterized protein Pyn_15036 [Prunus yedoensis var. nudiflora]|uniref:DUF4220 domain-containing protein n=1 Tax=Prunus yedoensis var. nudiflora TaxID=2094558 RepID=A0A314ZTA4_PRUYE|nr:uncharacterized protein Pyn_15036 [Prunus yedoensis var. nudiflora]
MSPNIFDYLGIAYIEIIYLMGLKDLRDKMKYRSSTPLTKELWEFIFQELKSKSLLADDPETAKRISLARGDWVLQDSDWNISEDSTLHRTLKSCIEDVEYDQSILLWHIATEFCFNKDEGNNKKDEGYDKKDESNTDVCKFRKFRKFSKTLSEYMLYLLVMQPTLTSFVAGIGQIRFRDTCAEAKKFFSRSELGSGKSGGNEQLVACERILGVNTEVQPVAVKGDRSKSVLFDACILAKQLMELKENKWELMSKVWVELLSYTASHCRANDHAQLLGKGGELVTFVWLLMAHFGIGEQFQINEGHARAKLIVGK